ncbi:tumor necrosis factor receptor superfamily member 6B-like [Chiloscyllium plagiosum]|uniref:tumor necrosis factor receptor superfamily member 6B-like n=1 Tax=Chiloscyllium plagiosum TaxID=36176 RepID=UPI001CB7D4C6|nr:tumor necrosis factor receptor superfamily member 6B-like [Chiloscyllium plagiosum]
MRGVPTHPNMLFKCLISIVLIEQVSSLFETVNSKPTYQRRDPYTGQMVTCEQCPPGTYVKTQCTSDHPTICESCPDLHYTQYWNYLQKCRYCNVFCGHHQYEKHQCNSTHNRVCECKAGYYLEFEFCLKHSCCPYGAGVIKKGTPYSDTNCEQCTDSHFSASVSSSESCLEHTNCTERGLAVNVAGNRYHDTLCTPCKTYHGHKPLVNDSVVSTCNEAIIEFVAYQKIPIKKLKRFLTLLEIEQAKKVSKQLKAQNKHMIHQSLHPLLVKWKEVVKEDHLLEKILHILQKAKMKNIIKNVQERFMLNVVSSLSNMLVEAE